MNCKSNKGIKVQEDELGFKQELKKTFKEGLSLEDCSEEISKLEDLYLANVKNLKGYSWDKKNFVASVEISNTKRLKISLIPSGVDCNFKLGLITFITPKSFSYKENKNKIIDDFLWVSKLVLNEKEYNLVNKVLSKERNAITNTNKENDFISLADEKAESLLAFFEKKEKNNLYSIIYLFK